MKRFLARPALFYGVFFVGSFLFFEINYRYWYRFMEQYSLFLYTEAYFMKLCEQPGGFNAYLTAFITRFFTFPYVSSVCLSLLLTLMSLLSARLLKKRSRLLSLFPAVLFCLFPVESIASVLAALTGIAAVSGYAAIQKPLPRYITGFALITVCYLLAAPAHLLAAAGMMICECYGAAGKKRFFPAFGWLIWALLCPLLAMRTLYVVPMREAFLGRHLFHPEYPIPASFWYIWCALPFIMLLVYGLRRPKPLFKEGLRQLAAVSLLVGATAIALVYGGHPLEQAYRYDWFARGQQWEAIVEDVARHPVKDRDALIYANLAHAYTGTFNEALLRLPQVGEDGFIPYDPKTRLELIEASEVSWLLNHTNSAQRFAFVGVLSSERNVQSRLMERLVETYLVNEEYKAAEKYIRILEMSKPHNPRIKELRRLLEPETSASTPWISERRRLTPLTDNPYDLTKTFPSALAFLIDDHPDNKAAFEYAMGYLLVYKELNIFMHYMEARKERGEPLPVVYQEAICLFYTAVQNEPETLRSYSIDPAVYQRFLGYMQQLKGLTPALLSRRYGDTYYYYAQFVQPPRKPVR
ncbi:MAG: DUF6057 family protein [Tannerellaceae bacterium]|jgi:hypothetical protein|nr:DUF6057 family protein [Tannerellaceae bacterium]